MKPNDLTERQLEQLMHIAGIGRLGLQSYYYGRSNVVNRNLAKRGLIERSTKGRWQLTNAGWIVLNGDKQ